MGRNKKKIKDPGLALGHQAFPSTSSCTTRLKFWPSVRAPLVLYRVFSCPKRCFFFLAATGQLNEPRDGRRG